MYEEIMRQITSGLSGEPKKDIRYLQEQMDKYKDHELSQEIIRGCSRLMSDLIPEDDMKAFNQAVGNDIKAIESVLDEVRFNMYKKKYKKALTLCERLVNSIEKLHMFENDSVSEYYTFHETFEEILYDYYNRTERTVRRASVPMSTIYFFYGNLLFEMGRMSEARNALGIARRWNPANLEIAFEYIETFKIAKDFEAFAELTKDAFKYAFKPNDIARCYRNLGFYFIEKEMYDAAAACHIISRHYDPQNTMSASELYYIQQITGLQFTDMSMEQIQECSEKYDFPVFPSREVVDIAVSYGQHCIKTKQYESAVYFLNIAYGITHDDTIKNALDQLSVLLK